MTLNYKTFGQGFPIIILHGLFGMLDNWQTIAKKLADNYTVYIVDQRNHGRSPHLSDFNYSLLAEDLHDFMEAHWMFEAHIIGHSMGGKTAMQFAASYPEKVKQLIVVDIAPKAYQASHQTIFKALQSLDLATLSNRREAASQLATQIKEEGTLQFLLKNLGRTKEGAFEWKMNLPVLYQHYDQILASIEVEAVFENPTLFIRGGTSNYIDLQDEPLIKEAFPAATMHTIPDVGHWVHAAAPEEFVKAVRAFLD